MFELGPELDDIAEELDVEEDVLGVSVIAREALVIGDVVADVELTGAVFDVVELTVCGIIGGNCVGMGDLVVEVKVVMNVCAVVIVVVCAVVVVVVVVGVVEVLVDLEVLVDAPHDCSSVVLPTHIHPDMVGTGV